MDSSDSLSESTLSCSSSSCSSKGYSKDSDEEMDEGTDFNIEPCQYEPQMEDNRNEESEEDCESEDDNDEAAWRFHSKDW